MSAATGPLVYQATAVAIEGRALLIEGPPGSGKSSLALALIERGAGLIGDDAVTLNAEGSEPALQLMVTPPPNTEGLIEVHGVGIIELPIVARAPVSLILDLGTQGARLPETIPTRSIMCVEVPCMPFDPGSIAPAQRALIALQLHGIRGKSG